MKFVYSSGARPLDGYTIKRGIGVGGFGEVYFATSDGGKEVALKRIQRNLDVELRGVRHCLNLKHANLIDLYDIRYDEEGGAWVVMEYVSGESLKDVLDRNPNGLPAEEVVRWFEGMARGVACLHDHGIVHRDLKPANIFSDDDTVKIGDYGLSKFISCSRRSGQTESVGTFHYMAPEIGKGVYGKEIDVYALGIILFEMLTGRVPFEGESSQEIIMKHLTADPDLQEVAEPYRSVIARALHKDPDKRFSSVAAMMEVINGMPLAESRSAEQVASTRHAEEDEPLVIAEDVRGDSAGAAARRVPPVRPQAQRETFYITEEGAGDDMVFGPVRRGAGQVARNRQQLASAPRAAAAPHAPRQQWSKVSTPVKILMLVAVTCLLLVFGRVLVPVAVAGGALLLGFFGIRTLVSAGAQTSAALQTAADKRRSLRQNMHTAWRRKPASETMSELTGSLLFSAAAAAVLSLLVVALADQPLEGSVGAWSLYLWLTMIGTAGAWTLLAAGKVWECSEGDGILRRFVMLCAGLALGIAAFGGAAFLHVSLDSPMDPIDVSPFVSYEQWYAPGHVPRLPAYLAYFAGLFVVLRWWTQVDPLRPARISLLATGLCVLWAWVLHTIFYFPQPWGMVLAGTVSIAAQLAAPWLTLQDRQRVQQQYQEA